MEPPRRLTLGYSLKNIPLPTESSYMKRLIEKVGSVIKRMRWRAFHYLTSGKDDHGDCYDEENYGLRSRRNPPHVEELEPFERDMEKLVGNVSFRKINDNFQNNLRKDINRIKSSESVFVAADKTRNLYEVGKEQYDKLLRDNITKHYRAADPSTYDEINEEARTTTDRLGPHLTERLDAMAKREAYVTLKDHKGNFANNLPCRLINPAKSEIGMISKRILDGINEQLRKTPGITMWRSSTAVIEWFQAIEDKSNCSFMCFDIVDFYPSITETLLDKALTWARHHVEISDDEMDIIFHSRRSLLFSKGKTWMKANSSKLFDVTMGSFDGAEVCELVGTFALAQLPNRYRAGNTGLYRDDGLAVFKGLSGSEADRARKDIVSHFKKLGLRLTIETNLKVTNFLDLTLNLTTGKHCPYRKPGDQPLYINRFSDHPPTILNQLPSSISRRLTDISHDREVFLDAAPLYNDALKNSGFSETVTYIEERKKARQKPCEAMQHRQRKRNITWFNPPFSRSVETKIGQKFLRLIDLHFPKGSKLHKVFNKNTVKVSYSCMPSVGAIIKGHNSRVCSAPDGTADTTTRRCNCRRPDDCPLSGNCLASCVVYQATVKSEGTPTEMHYIGSTETTFKLRYANHKASITHASKANATELSKHVWQLKRANIAFNLTWKILKQAQGYTNKSKRCHLCLTEKLMIARADKASLLNKRAELATKCRHENKFYLSNFAHNPT